eukprot:g2612.t1
MCIPRPPDNLLGQMPKTRAGQWNVGHDAFSSASVWLENVARQGKRVGDRQTAEPVVYKGDMTLKEFKKMKEPVRRLIANAGALPARKLVKVQDDQALFEPLSKDCRSMIAPLMLSDGLWSTGRGDCQEERDMKVILQMISEKAAQRFGSIRDALRHLDADCDGSVDRGEAGGRWKLMAHPYFRSGFYLGSLVFFLALASSMSDLTRAHAVFRECVAAIGDPNVLVTIFTSMVLSVIRISFILHVCRSLALLMSIVTPVEVELQLFGEIHWVPRTAWSPFFLRGVFFYMFGTFWTLEFLSFSNKYITAQVLCANYFHLKARNLQMQEISSGRPAPIRYALYSMIETFLKVSVGLTSMIWAFFLFREPRRGAYHQVEELKLKDSVANMFVTPQHSPLLSMPVLFFFGLWVGDGMLHLVTMASNALTICYCIDVEMVGGTETDALYAPQGLKLVYRDLGGGESERELAELMANNAIVQ